MTNEKQDRIMKKTTEQALEAAISNQLINSLIYIVRGQPVMLDSDLASLYQVETKVFNQAVKRNITRFPYAFRFQLTNQEYESLKSQYVTSNSRGGRRYMPYAFTEPGIAMLSAVLHNYLKRSAKLAGDRRSMKDGQMSVSLFWMMIELTILVLL